MQNSARQAALPTIAITPGAPSVTLGAVSLSVAACGAPFTLGF